jgi:hypothetical protein
MSVQNTETASRFSERILRLLERVEHRSARTPSEKEAVYRLRYEAYIRNGLIDAREDGLLRDENYDDAPNTWITMTFIDGQLAATTRVSLGVDENATLPSLGVFSDVILPHLRAGRVIVDFTRAAARLEASKQYPELPYIALRAGYMAAEHFNADFAVATARAEHLAFYRRVFHFVPWCEPRSYPNVTAKIACMGADFHAVRSQIEARHPFFRSTAAERGALFGSAPQARIDTARREKLAVRACA